MKIQIDDREPMVMEMMCEAGGMEVEVCRLKECDYLCRELEVCIERKTINDFCGSVMDGRLKEQVGRMKKNYEHCFVLVSGRLKDRTSEIHEHSVLGMMVSLIVKNEVNIIMFDDDEQLVWFMNRLFQRYEEMWKARMRGEVDE